MYTPMRLGIVIPTVGLHNLTQECISTFASKLKNPKETQVVVVDNLYKGQNTSILEEELKQFSDTSKIIKNKHNLGYWDSVVAGIDALDTDLALCMHNDVFIYEQDFDDRIIDQFYLFNNLAMAGFFGGRGLSIDGGRGHPESNMVGKWNGTHGSLHGSILTTSHPAVIFDSLAMIFRLDYLNTIEYRDLPPHHWTDRLICLRLLAAGYDLRTVGIEFDHGGSYTSTATYDGESLLDSFAREWCAKKGLQLEENWNHTLYMYGLRMFQHEYRKFLGSDDPVWVRKDIHHDWKCIYHR